MVGHLVSGSAKRRSEATRKKGNPTARAVPGFLVSSVVIVAVMLGAWVGVVFSRPAPVEEPAPWGIRIDSLQEKGKGVWIKMPGYQEIGSPVLSRDQKWIAFDGYRKGFDFSAGDCWVVGHDGKGLRKLAVGATPRFSPDGKQVLFMRDIENDRSREPGIFLINFDGTKEKRILYGRWPDWSPDGKQIVYSAGGERGTWGGSRIGSELFIANVDGGQSHKVADGDCPSWSPDGKKIAFCIQDPEVSAPTIHVLDLKSQAKVTLGYGWCRPNWSGDSKSVVINGIFGPGMGMMALVRFSANGRKTPETIPSPFQHPMSPFVSWDNKEVIYIAGTQSQED